MLETYVLLPRLDEGDGVWTHPPRTGELPPQTAGKMSLRAKIILLFMALAVLPLLVLAGFSFWQARSLLREAVGSQLLERAQIAGREVELARSEIREALLALSESPAIEAWRMGTDESTPLALSTSPALEGAAYVRMDRAPGPSRLLSGRVPDESTRCRGEGGSRLVELEAEARPDENSGNIVAGFWASELISGGTRRAVPAILLLDAQTGQVLYSEMCEDLEAPAEILADPGLEDTLDDLESAGTLWLGHGWDKMAAFVRVPGTEWTVLSSSSPASALASLSHLMQLYWAFVLTLGLLTSLAFSILLGRFTRSLRDLVRAAEEIGTGELDPWLPLPSPGEIGHLTTAFSRMLDRIRQMMEQVDQSGRLAVVGQLSAYLAHEIRNPLSSIKLNLQRLRRWTRDGALPEFCREPLEISLREVERLNASVSGVLQLSKAQDSPKEVVSLHHLVEEAADLLSGKFRRQGVELSLDLDAEADRIVARAGQVKSLILNLMVNALEAQPQGGELDVRSELSRGLEDGSPVVALRFKDRGGGVPGEIRDRIFEPFFTTKTGGSGIGLAMASQAARENNGEIYLEPAFPAEGSAEFVVVFPLAAADIRPSADTALATAGRQELSARWSAVPRRARDAGGEWSPAPLHLMTPEGLRTVLPPAPTDPGEAT